MFRDPPTSDVSLGFASGNIAGLGITKHILFLLRSSKRVFNETRANADRPELTAGDPPSADASCLPSSGAAWEKYKSSAKTSLRLLFHFFARNKQPN